MNELNFQPKVRRYTVVYDAEGNEIDRMEGAVVINGRDYADRLPIEYRQIEVQETLLNVFKVER